MTLARKLKAIHRRMAAVSEDEVLSALCGERTTTISAGTVVQVQYLAYWDEVRRGLALTKTE